LPRCTESGGVYSESNVESVIFLVMVYFGIRCDEHMLCDAAHEARVEKNC